MWTNPERQSSSFAPAPPTYFTTSAPTMRDDLLNVQADGRLAAHLRETPASHIMEEDVEPNEDLTGDDFTYSHDTTIAFQELLSNIDSHTKELPNVLSTKHYAAASVFRIKKNPLLLIAPKLSLSGVDWWTEWSKTLTLLSSLERFQNMDYLIPTLSKDFQGVIPRPSTSDRDLRWLKALVRQGVDYDLVTPVTWHSFRVFIPDCTYQLGIPRAQRQYLKNWQTESTANIYTREKRNVVVDIWSKVLGKIQEVDKQPGRTVREDLAHPDWDDKPLDKPRTQRVSMTPMDLSWSNRMLRLDSLNQKGAQTRPVPNILQL